MSTNPPPAALAAGAALAQRLVGAPRPARPARTAAAGLLGTASAALLASAVREFRRTRTTVNPLEPATATALVTSGPNRLSRNPMYVGMAGLLTSYALLRGRWPALLPVAAFVVTIDRGQIAAEEAALRERFPGDYAAYAARVPRWVGPVRSPRPRRLGGPVEA
jgi:protein-S-isoprenylcysteine O-methyltransferase Ste14